MSHQLQPEPPIIKPNSGPGKTFKPTNFASIPVDPPNNQPPPVPNGAPGSQGEEIPTAEIGVFKIEIPDLKHAIIRNSTSAAQISGLKLIDGVNVYTVHNTGLYSIGPESISRVNPSQISYNPVMTTPEPPKTPPNCDSGSDWWKEERWMKAKLFEPVGRKEQLDYRDLRKNWWRFAVLSGSDRTLRFNTLRLRKVRRTVFGEVVSRGMRHRRDTGIDYGKKEIMVQPKINPTLQRNKKLPPPVFRSVPKVFYEWSNSIGKTNRRKRSAPQAFYDWSKRMEERNFVESLAELTDFERFLAHRARVHSDSSKTDFQRFVNQLPQSDSMKESDSENASEHSDIDLVNYNDLGLSGFGVYKSPSDSSGISTDDGDSTSSFMLDDINDDYSSDDWQEQE